MIDDRIIILNIEVDGAIKSYSDLYISAKGKKFTSPMSGECEITLLNMNRETREYLMREANPFNSNAKSVNVSLEVGRESYGTSTLYTGEVFRVWPTEKPNLGLTIKCITGNANRLAVISRSALEVATLSSIAEGVAADNGLSLSFEVEDKNVSNYSYSGSINGSIKSLENLSGGDVFVDNGVLFIKATGSVKTGATVRVLNKNTGMIGAPKGTESGVAVTMLYDPVTQIGSKLELESEINPVLNGNYSIYKLEFDVSNRDKPFYLMAEASRLNG